MLPRLQSVGASFACGLLALVIGYSIFRRYQDRFVFYL
jgi:ABC-type polysaccharide/polyol phosphate export permease